MATNPVEDNCINFVGMKFIDNTLYFVAENDDNLESDYFSGSIYRHDFIIEGSPRHLSC